MCALDYRAGGGAPAMGSRLPTLAGGFGVRTSLEALQPTKLPSFGGYSFETFISVRLSLFYPAGIDRVSAFLNQNNNKLFFFLHALLALSRLVVALLD